MFALTPDIKNIGELAQHIGLALLDQGIDTPQLDARLLIQHVCGIDHAAFIARQNEILTAPQRELLTEIIQRRLKREPLSRIFGKAEFWSLEFQISKDTLDPRPDTETLIELILDMTAMRRSEPLRILDLGTGSGCILLSLLHELPLATGVGADISSGAIATAYENARSLNLETRAHFVESDWFSNVAGLFDVIVSNPPYIPQAEIDNLAPEVAVYEPRSALNGGDDGLAPYRIILDKASSYLSPAGIVAFEFGCGQDADISELILKSPLTTMFLDKFLRADLAGINRVIGLSTKSAAG